MVLPHKRQKIQPVAVRKPKIHQRARKVRSPSRSRASARLDADTVESPDTCISSRSSPWIC